MNKIATHNSATGERPANFLSRLLIPFCRTQNKTIELQYIAGCSMFDLRAKKYNGKYHLAHGLYITERTVEEVLHQINNYIEPCYVLLTYEGRLNPDELNDFEQTVKAWKDKFDQILWGAISVKYTDNDPVVDWQEICKADCEWPATVQGFVPLDGKTWQTYLPIPWLWKKLYHNKPVFNETAYTFVDFL